jgi:hypothetical protein
MDDKLITKMEKNSQEEIRFSLQEYRGTDLIDIRVYYDGGGGERIATRKGISIPLDLFDEFMKRLAKVKKVVESDAR